MPWWIDRRIPVKELEAVLREAEREGWRVTKGKLYFKMWCPCPGKHMKTVHLTPSSSRYETNLRSYLSRYNMLGEGAEAVKIAVLLEMSEGLPRNEKEFDALADALYEMDAADPGIEDMDLTAAIVAGPLVISMTVDAEDLEGALHKAVVTLRAALHQIGLGTPGWEKALASMEVRLTSSRQLVA